MQTHRYSRQNRPTGTTDSYDSLSTKYPPQFSHLEYWTNGNVTHLMSSSSSEPAVPMSAPDAVFQNFNAPVRRLTAPSKPASNSVPTNKESNVVRDSIIAGSLAGIASTSTFYPFDVLRTKMQSAAAHETTSVSSQATKSRSLSAVSTAHRGPLQVLFHTLQHGGISALYTGLALPLTAQAVYKATVFSVNKVTTKALAEYKTQERRKLGDFTPIHLTMMDRFWCGFVGGAINAALFVTPVEFVRNQLIAQHTRKSHGVRSEVHFAGPRDVIRHTVATQGVVGLWKGASMAVARDALGCGCFFWTFHYLSQRLPQDEASSTLVAGAASGLAFWIAALPLDTGTYEDFFCVALCEGAFVLMKLSFFLSFSVKTWVQNGSAPSGTAAIAESLSEHGVLFTAQRLCRGYQVALGRGMPAAAVTITTYEAVYRYLQQHL